MYKYRLQYKLNHCDPYFVKVIGNRYNIPEELMLIIYDHFKVRHTNNDEKIKSLLKDINKHYTIEKLKQLLQLLSESPDFIKKYDLENLIKMLLTHCTFLPSKYDYLLTGRIIYDYNIELIISSDNFVYNYVICLICLLKSNVFKKRLYRVN